MTEQEAREFHRLAGVVEALTAIVTEIAMQLPERAMYIVAQSALALARQAEAEAREKDTDILRDRAAAIYDMAYPLNDALEAQIEEVQDGGRIRTVQPFPIPPEEWIDGRPF